MAAVARLRDSRAPARPRNGVRNRIRQRQDDRLRHVFTEVAESGYSYDGQGVTVEWSPSSACTDNRGAGNHNCLFEGEAPQPDGNNAQRGQGNNAQYQIFSGQDDVTIANVNFKFVPADFTLCMNSGWAGAFTADVVKNAELQLLNTGDVTFSNCGFDGVIASPYASTTNSTFTGCNFSNVYNGYAIKDVRSASASISSCTFTNCGGGIYFEGATAKGAIDITGNTFTDVDTYAAEDKKFTRGLIQFSAAGDYSNASIDISGNTSTGGAGAIRQLNTSPTAGVLELDAVLANNSFDGSELTDSSFGTNTVYYNGSYYPTLTAALASVYTSSPAGTAKIYCEPGADVGTMTHGHVADDLVIYGNGAYVSGGERDLEIDTYKYDRATGVQNANGTVIAKLPHNFVNGTCSVCGATDSGYVAPSDPSNPTDESDSKPLGTTGSGSLAKTSDSAGMLIGFAALIACAAGAVVAMAARARKA